MDPPLAMARLVRHQRGAGGLMEIVDLAAAFAWQAQQCERAGAPITARIIRGAGALAGGATPIGRAIAAWPGLALEDALPLRIAGGLHFLHLTGDASELAPIYAATLSDARAIAARIEAVARRHEEELGRWLAGPPQTNEAGRSASVVAGLLWLAQRIGPRFCLFEIGASAGINTMLARYRYRLGTTDFGPPSSPMRLAPEWRGASPPSGPLRIESARGCDIAPVDLADPAHNLRLKAYVWADAAGRMARLDTAIAMARQQPPSLIRQDAAGFVDACLGESQPAGVARALFHTVMWHYLPAATRAAICARMAQAGALATPERPLAWLKVEMNRATSLHELQVRWWAGGRSASGWVRLAHAHPHGQWVEWQGG